MINEQLIVKLQEDMETPGFSKYTKSNYYSKAKDIIRYFEKNIKEVTIKEIR